MALVINSGGSVSLNNYCRMKAQESMTITSNNRYQYNILIQLLYIRVNMTGVKV